MMMKRISWLLAGAVVVAPLAAGCSHQTKVGISTHVSIEAGFSDAEGAANVTLETTFSRTECTSYASAASNGNIDCTTTPVSPAEDDDARVQGGPSGALVDLSFDASAGLWRGSTLGYADTYEIQATASGETYSTRDAPPVWPSPKLSPAYLSANHPATLQWTPTLTPYGPSPYSFVKISVTDLATGQVTKEVQSIESPDDGVQELPAEAFPMPGRYEVRMEQTTFPDALGAPDPNRDGDMFFTLLTKTQIDVQQ